MSSVTSAVAATSPPVTGGGPPPAAPGGGDPAAAAPPAGEPPAAPVCPHEPTPVREPTGLSIELTIRAVVRPLSPSSDPKPPSVMPREDDPSRHGPNDPTTNPARLPPRAGPVNKTRDDRRPLHNPGDPTSDPLKIRNSSRVGPHEPVPNSPVDSSLDPGHPPPGSSQ
ncbi:hypothetical protein E2562_031831, partial [Oryza meyeriana var. granulata]